MASNASRAEKQPETAAMRNNKEPSTETQSAAQVLHGDAGSELGTNHQLPCGDTQTSYSKEGSTRDGCRVPGACWQFAHP